MAAADKFPQTKQEHDIRDAMAKHFLEAISKDPATVDNLSDKLWNRLSPDEQAEQTAVVTVLFGADLVSREQATKAHLVIKYLGQQAQEASELNNLYELPPLKAID